MRVGAGGGGGVFAIKGQEFVGHTGTSESPLLAIIWWLLFSSPTWVNKSLCKQGYYLLQELLLPAKKSQLSPLDHAATTASQITIHKIAVSPAQGPGGESGGGQSWRSETSGTSELVTTSNDDVRCDTIIHQVQEAVPASILDKYTNHRHTLLPLVL